MEHAVIEPASREDLEPLTELLADLFEQEADFHADRAKQERAVQLILDEPSRGRIFVLRHHGRVLGMINMLVTISTAEGGFAMVLEDLVVHRDFRGHGFGSKLLQFAIDFAREKEFLRITLLTDLEDERTRGFYRRHGFSDSSMVPMRLLLQPAIANGTA